MCFALRAEWSGRLRYPEHRPDWKRPLGLDQARIKVGRNILRCFVDVITDVESVSIAGRAEKGGKPLGPLVDLAVVFNGQQMSALEKFCIACGRKTNTGGHDLDGVVTRFRVLDVGTTRSHTEISRFHSSLCSFRLSGLTARIS